MYTNHTDHTDHTDVHRSHVPKVICSIPTRTISAISLKSRATYLHVCACVSPFSKC
jgi:hypothetical protein